MNITEEYNKIKKLYDEEQEKKRQAEKQEKERIEREESIRRNEEYQNSVDAMHWNNIKDIFDNVKGNLGDEDTTYALCAFIYAIRTGSSTKEFYESLASVKRTLAEQKKQNKKS